MKDKLISANALIEHLDVTIAESKGLIGSTCVAIKCYVEQMPAVDMPKWIPVTERMPSDDIPSTMYLCFWNGIIRVCKYWRTRKCLRCVFWYSDL